MTRLRATTLSVCCFLILWVTSDVAQANEDWSITVYNAVLTAWDLETVVKFEAEFEEDYQLWALAVAKKVGSFTEHINIEIEGQIVQHTGEQDYMEFNGLGVARWLTFPWNRYLATSFAAGTGVSYGTELSEIEVRKSSNANRWAAYLLFELAFSLPRVPAWSLVGRLHHRSDGLGLFDAAGYNAVGLGVKYRF
jgi:hypothetical protein